MELKARQESEELLALRYLNARMELMEKDKFNYCNLEKGYEGELRFDTLTVDLQEERFIMNGLLLKVNNSYVQIDTLLISQGMIHLLEVKNFEGDFFIESDKFFSVTTHREYKNPLIQLQRATTMLRQLLQSLKQNYLVDSSVIFINPEFTLYQSSMDSPFIMPTQVNRFLRDINKTPSKLNEGHRKLAQSIISLHHTKNPFAEIPDYSYDMLEKGVYCKHCRSFSVTPYHSQLLCKKCGKSEPLEEAILRNVREMQFLFPERRITTSEVYEWCGLEVCQRTYNRILKRNLIQQGKTKDTHYLLR